MIFSSERTTDKTPVSTAVHSFVPSNTWPSYTCVDGMVRYCEEEMPRIVFLDRQTQVVKEGCCDWKDLSWILQRHEQSQGHMECMIKWMEFYKGIKHGKTIDKDYESLIKESQKAHRESLKLNDSRHSGNFIDLFKLSKYDLTLREHMQRTNEKQLTQHYLSHDIQNELIALMSKSVIEEIIHRVKQAKYYAFLLDCTRDVSRVEQMSIILRFCNSSTGAIEEHFVGPSQK
ncbi:TTF-type domain-containing protein [Trichonephila clavipes]|uniref:TTF-type domain-containing protein n=1 Tax=Trichonephila clavipes TaxID=2585209 RepID=A0A8X6RRK3_TRICX|nr:TTF-type domain-containing protein [Trichonephila clavipes]